MADEQTDVRTPLSSDVVTTSASIDVLATAVSAMQGDPEHPLIAIPNREQDYFKSGYADLAAVWQVIRRPLQAQGLAVFQPAGYRQADGVVEVTTIIAHGESGQWIRSTLAMAPEKEGPQAIGICISYCRRYALQSILGVVCPTLSNGQLEDDDGEGATNHATDGLAAAKPTPKAKAKAKPRPKLIPKARAAHETAASAAADLRITNVEEDTFTSKAGKETHKTTVTLSDGRRCSTIFSDRAEIAMKAWQSGAAVYVTLSTPSNPAWMPDLEAIEILEADTDDTVPF